jgi:large subunit ribosomal protein L6
MPEGELTLERPSDAKPHRAKHGLYRSLIANMVKGVSEGFVIEQELVGVGYRATAKGQQLQLAWASRTPSPSTFPRRSR